MRLLKKAVVMIAGVLALLLAMGAGWERLERRQAAAAYPPPGRMVDIGGRRMQIECRGAGSPTVVFETGLDYYGELAWAKVLGPVSRFTPRLRLQPRRHGVERRQAGPARRPRRRP